ncbi:MAG: helix-turn-helix transcriptional regulator [Synechococcaceae cyanobacterium SM2_3_1]|nr:helix-turn-helix transcriptional regulator [Synechococcaceae cyanobacterium SM2_3_1]
MRRDLQSSPTTFAARLRQAIGDEAIYAFARRARISDTALRSYLKGSVPGIDKVVLIAETANVHLHWLITGEGSPDTDTSGPSDQAEMIYIPFVDVAASAGTGVLVHDEMIREVIGFDAQWLRTKIKGSPADLSLITVQGDSMAPTLQPGDMIFVDHKITDLRDGIYVFQMDGNLLVKRLQKLPGSQVSVISDNPRFPPFTLDLNDTSLGLQIVGRFQGRLSFES